MSKYIVQKSLESEQQEWKKCRSRDSMVRQLSREYDLSIPENVEKSKSCDERANSRVAEPLSQMSLF